MAVEILKQTRASRLPKAQLVERLHMTESTLSQIEKVLDSLTCHVRGSMDHGSSMTVSEAFAWGELKSEIKQRLAFLSGGLAELHGWEAR